MASVEALPLDQMRVTRGQARDTRKGVTPVTSSHHETLPALHSDWKKPIQFVVYLPPPDLNVRLMDPGKWEAWQERITFIEEDLHWLLKLPHDKFWSQVVYDETLQKCLDSYLRYAPRSFDKDLDLTGEFLQRHKNVHKLVFMACLRMSTHKESKEHFITPSVFADLIYDNFLFDVPKLMDVAVLYGGDNFQLVQKMIENVFKQQPKYLDDVVAAVPTMQDVLKSIKTKLGATSPSSSPAPLPRVARTTAGTTSPRPRSPQPSVGQLSEDELKDVVLYLADVAYSLNAFLEARPSVAAPFFERDFHLDVTAFYEAVIPTLRDAHLTRRWEDIELRDFLREKILRAHLLLPAIFRQILQTCCVQPLLETVTKDAGDSLRISNLIDSYLQALTTALSHRKFVAAYETQFPINDDLDVVSQFAGSFCDETQLNFIIDGFKSSVSDSIQIDAKQPKSLSELLKSNAGGDVRSRSVEDTFINAVAAANRNRPDPTPQAHGATAREVSGVELDSLITNVKDILPDLGEGFIEAALEDYAFNSENVINALLEDNLSPRLQALDRTSKTRKVRKPKKPTPAETYEEEHKNIYDQVGFDGLKDFHIGKKDVAKNAKTLMDDKSQMEKSRYIAYANADVGSGSIYDPEKTYMYDDEYDDTYDDQLVGADDADNVDELGTETGRNFVVPTALQRLNREKPSADDQEEDDDDEEQNNVPPWRRSGNTLGIEDPSILRERAAQRRAARGGRRGGGGGGPPPQVVEGNPKGQGQEKSTEIARKRKDANKATRANHNRKSQAGRKQARGMF